MAGVLVLCAFAAGPATAQASRVSADFNCDGFDDLAIGVPTENVANGAASNLDAGAVNVIYGSGNRLNATTTPNRIWTQQDLEGGASTGDRFGSAVAAGDFSGDGCDDLAVGVPGENIPFNGATVLDAGAVNVIKGSPTGLTATGNTLWTQDPLAGTPEAGDQFGSSLTAGRLNTGGYDDLAVGVPGENDGAGAVNVIFGANGGPSSSGNTVRAQGLQGPGTAEPGDAFGKALASGDFDDDGYDDLAIGVPGENEEGNTSIVNSGAVNVIYGATLTLSTTRFQVWHQFWDNWEDNDRYGSSLATGDFDNDSYHDLAVGAPGEDDDSGAVSVIYGKWSVGLDDDDADFWTQASPDISGAPEPGDLFGSSLAAGDLNPGGNDDLAIGVPGEDLATGTSAADGGAVHVLYGAGNGVNQQGEQLWTQDSTSLAGDDAQTSDTFGSSLTIGNFNGGDGYEDLAVGVPGEDVISGSGAITNAGAVNVIYGALVGLTTSGNQFWSQADLEGALGGGDGFGAALPT